MNDSEQAAPQWNSQLVYWIFQLAGWGVIALARFIAGVSVLDLAWPRLLWELLLVNAAGLVLSHWLRGYVRRHRWRELPIRKLAWRILVASFVCGAPIGIVTQFTYLSALVDPSSFLRQYAPAMQFRLLLPFAILVEVVNWACVFIAWLTIYFTAVALREHRSAQFKQSELARALQLAELRLLKSQLNPHFLFNALNTVRSLIAENPARAQNAVTRLANTLRYSLTSPQDELVTLSQELDIVAEYLELESMRFEDRLRIELSVPDDAGGVKIPVMLLQTLVENAIKHGIAQLPAGGLLRVSASLADGMLILEIENPRPATTPIGAPYEGVGLRNASDRLKLLFGSRASLELDVSQPALATARLRIPMQL
jgi:Histidine kinase